VRAATITIIRHGETPANVEGVWHGSTDTPLTRRGRRQAERAALHIWRTRGDARAVYTSPLCRARDTAAPIAARLGVALHTESDLREYHLGEWEGAPFRELTRRHRLFERMREEADWRPGGGESPRAVAQRLGGALRALARRHPGERVVVVTHGGAFALGLGWLLDGLPTPRRVVENGSVSDLSFAPAPQLQSLNHTLHLEALP